MEHPSANVVIAIARAGAPSGWPRRARQCDPAGGPAAVVRGSLRCEWSG